MFSTSMITIENSRIYWDNENVDCRIQAFVLSIRRLIRINGNSNISRYSEFYNRRIHQKYTNMIKKLLLTVIVSTSASASALAGQDLMILPLGNDATGHFHNFNKDWGCLWKDHGQPGALADLSCAQADAPFTTMPTHRPEADLAFTMPTHRPEADLAFTMPTHRPEADLAFTMPTHRPEADLAFTMPTHRPEADLAFTMPTHRPEADLAFTMPTHRPEADLAFTMPTHRPPTDRLSASQCRPIARRPT